MVTKGIITSIDFNGNTCQVRIPLFETAGNDPITGTAIVSNTPGSYNGYKVGDVVLVAFEDGKMQNPVIVGKLYLGAAKEKQDPRGTINVETTTASKSATLPADAVLTANVDSNVPNTNTPFGSLASIANNLNSLNTDVNQLDRFTRNQFNSVITDVNDQGEQLRSEIKQTASNIEANVVHKHQNGSQNALGWDLDEKEWKINAQDTVTNENGETEVKNINIVTIDRNGMSIAGDLKLSGYPRNITVLYAQNGSDKDYPELYNFTEVKFPVPFPSVGEDKDKTWYYGKYIKIEEKYVLIFKENFEYYKELIDLDTTKAYSREINPEWKTEAPGRTDGKYIWQWTHTEIYSFDGDKWSEKDDDKIACITGADGKDGYSTATIMLYKRSNDGVPEVDWGDAKETVYTFSSKTLSVVPTDWEYTIADAGNASDGELYCIAAIASSNTDTDTIAVKEFGNPILYAKNGEPTVTLSIENDFDSIPCDYDGKPSYSDTDWKTKTSHTIKVLEGQDQQQFSVIADSSDKQIPSTGYAVVYKPDSSITYHADTTDKTFFTAYITGLTADSANVLYTLYKNGIAIDEARFTATKLKAGAPGDPAVDYDILFSSGTIKVSKTGDKNPRTINVNFKKTVGQAEPVDFSGTYKVFIDNGTEPISQGTASSIILATSGAADQQIDVSSAKSSVIVELYTADGNTKLEGETIDVVADGTDGTSVAQLILYKRSTKIPSGPASDGKWTYNAAKGSLTCENQETKWKTGIPSGTEPCYESHAAVLVTGLGTITIEDEKWSEPAKFVENGADGKPGDSVYTISIDNDFDSVPADVNGNVSNSYQWESETKHNVRVYYGKDAQDFTVVGQSGTAPSTGLCLKYKLTNVDLGNTPSVSDKVATAWINSLSADAGNILYTLYVDSVETGITGKFSVAKIKSPASTYTISIDNDFATIPTSTVNAKIYRKISQKFKPADNGYSRETITVADTIKKLPGMRLSVVNNTTNLNTALLWKPDEVIKITSDRTKSYVEDITKHNVTVYCNDAVETITADNFIVKLDSDGLDANMDETQNYLVCELGGFDSTGARATDFPGMKPTVNDNVVTNYITALSALGDSSESKNVYIQYTYYAKGAPVATAKFEVTRHTGPTTYYLSSNVSTIKVNKDATITPNKVTCTAYSLDTSTNTNTIFTNGTWKYKWDDGALISDISTASDLEISTADVITNKYKQLYIELYLDKQLWDRETIDVVADGENAVDYNILVDNGQIKRDPNDHTKDTSSVTFSFYKWNGSTRSNFNGAHFNCYIDGVGPDHRQCDGNTNTFTVNADSNPAISSVTKNIKVELLDKQNGTVVESETIDVVVNGSNGLYITNTKQWYKLVANGAENPKKPTNDIVVTDENGNTTHTTDEGWSDIPLDAINDMNLWTSLESIFSDDIPSDPKKRHIKFSDPVKDAAYALAQGKTTNYYSPTKPINNIKEGDCWFDTSYVKIDPNPDKKAGYLGKFVVCQASTEGSVRVEASGANRYIPNENGSTYLVKITPENINKINIEVGTTAAYETGNLKQWDGKAWKDIAGELVTNKLTANYINALDITTKKITVLQDAAAAIEKQKILFEADGTNAAGKVKIADFDVNHESLHSFSNKNGYELNIKSANDVELDKQITIDDYYMQFYNINNDDSTSPQIAWDEMKSWPTDGQASNDELPINDTSVTNNYTLLQLNTRGTTPSDTNPDSNLWLKARGYISFFRIDILQDILDFNIWIGIINSTSKLNRTDYLSSQDTVRLFSSTTKFTTWAALNKELENFKSGSASALSELGYCRPAIGDETSKMPTSGSLTDNLVKFSWGNLSANTYLYCIVENNYPRDYVISSSEGQGQTNTWTDTYGNIHTTIIPGGADAKNVPGYLRAFLILDKTFTKYGAAISAGYNGEDFILTGDGKVIASNILITGGSINADSGNMGPLEISDGEINTAGLMINKSSTHIKNGASLKILGKSGNTTKPIAKLSKNGFIISPQGMQAENNKYFSYKIGEVNGANDEKNTPGLLWKQRSNIQYDTVYVKATLNKDDKKITFNLYSKYSEDGLKTKYETSSIPANKTLDVVVYLKYAVKRLQKRKISKKIDINGNGELTNFISLPEKTIITVSPIQFKFKKDDPNPKEISFTNLGTISTIYGISNTKGGAMADELTFTTLAPTDDNVIDPNLYITSSILPASTFISKTNEETKNEYDLGSSTYPWNNVYSKYFYGVSDRREKTDITPLSEQNNLDEFYNKLKPVSFSFKSSNDTLHFGLIAQDVDEASAGLPTDKPLAIVNKSDPNCLSIDYQELIAVNILKIQQLSKKIDSLEAEIKCLKGED